MAAAAARKKNTTSLSLFMEAFGLEGEEELSTVATRTWAEGAWTGKWYTEPKEAWLHQTREVQMWRQVRGPAGAVMCETRDLGIKWPHCHTLIFECEARIEMRYWKKWAAKHMYEEIEGGYLARASSRVSAQPVTRRKAQISTGSTIAEDGTKSDGRSQKPSENGSKKREPQRRSGNGKEVL